MPPPRSVESKKPGKHLVPAKITTFKVDQKYLQEFFQEKNLIVTIAIYYVSQKLVLM